MWNFKDRSWTLKLSYLICNWRIQLNWFYTFVFTYWLHLSHYFLHSENYQNSRQKVCRYFHKILISTLWFSELIQCQWWHFNFSQISSSSLDVHAWLIQISAANVNTDQKLVYGARCRYSNSSHLLLFLRLHFLTAMSISSLHKASRLTRVQCWQYSTHKVARNQIL